MTDQQTTDDLNTALSSMVLLKLTLNQWQGNKVDKKLTKDYAASMGAETTSFAVTKKLMSSTSEYSELTKAFSKCRTFIRDNTAFLEGYGHSVGPARCMTLLGEFVPLRQDALAKKAAFLAVYPQAVSKELAKQGAAADPNQYPSVSEIAGLFDVKLDVLPMPMVADFSRLSIPTEAAEFLGGMMERRQKKAMDDALGAVKLRVVKQLDAIIHVLSRKIEGEPTRITESLIGTAETLVSLVREVNLTADPEIDKIADELAAVTVCTPAQLRNNMTVAQQTVDKAKALRGKMLDAAPSDNRTPDPVPASIPPADDDDDDVSDFVTKATGDHAAQSDDDVDWSAFD